MKNEMQMSIGISTSESRNSVQYPNSFQNPFPQIHSTLYSTQLEESKSSSATSSYNSRAEVVPVPNMKNMKCSHPNPTSPHPVSADSFKVTLSSPSLNWGKSPQLKSPPSYI